MAIGIIANDKTNKLHLNKKNKYYDSTFKVSLNDTNESHAIITSNTALIPYFLYLKPSDFFSNKFATTSMSAEIMIIIRYRFIL